MSRTGDDHSNRNRLIGHLRRRASAGDDAEDIVQEAYARLEAYSGRAAVTDEHGFIWRTALNLATSLRRRQAVRDSAHADSNVVHFLHPPAPLPDEVLAVRERLRIVEQAIEELPERCRAVFVAVRIEGMTYSAAARAFGVSVSAIEKHMARAIAHLTVRAQGIGRDE